LQSPTAFSAELLRRAESDDLMEDGQEFRATAAENPSQTT